MLEGESFVFRSGSDGFHLYVVVSDPFQDPNRVLVVNLTTMRGVPFEDLSCVFVAGEHAKITQPSYVAYKWARTYTDKHLERLKASKSIQDHPMFDANLLSRIRAGAQLTQDLPEDFVQLLIDQGFG